MEAKELLSMILSYESEIEDLYARFNNDEISEKEFSERMQNFVKKQIELIEQFRNK